MAMQMAVALLALSMLASGVAAQSPTPACASKLVPCGPYMNSTGPPPPESCCGPLKDAVKNDLPCLCALYAKPEIFKALNVNITEALNLSKRCGVSDTTTACAGAPGKSPPGSPSGGGSGSGSGSNSGHRTLSIGVPGLMSMFLALWSVLA